MRCGTDSQELSAEVQPALIKLSRDCFVLLEKGHLALVELLGGCL